MVIVEYPSRILSTIAKPVVEFNDQLRKIIEEMIMSMYAFSGVGLAAPQVNIPQRIVIIDSSGGEDSNLLKVLINPDVTWTSSTVMTGEEGCLSLPGVELSVPRPIAVTVEYFDVKGDRQRLRCLDPYEARIVQHEIDHLNGVMMLDRVGALAKKLAMKR